MQPQARSPSDPSYLAERVDHLRAALRSRNLAEAAQHAGAAYLSLPGGANAIQVKLWEQMIILPLPGLVAHDSLSNRELSLPQQALLLYYLTTADGSPPAGEWVAFSDLPGGRFYSQAFQGYTGGELSRRFQADIPAFTSAAQAAGGIQLHENAGLPGDACFRFQPLPRISLLVAYWAGDEDIPGSFHLLFDRWACHYLPIDVYAVLGSMLTRRILSTGGRP